MHQLLTGAAEGLDDDEVARPGDVAGSTGTSKVMTAADAVARYVKPRHVVGMGGQNINRCPMALVHEVIRQRPEQLSIVGCNLSLPVDLLVTAGLVAHTEQGSGNLERYGVLFAWRRALESGSVTTNDHTHLSMASRFLAGAMGLPSMPTGSLLGSSVLTGLQDVGVASVVVDPFGGTDMVLVKAQTPDVSLIHVSRADTNGNAVIEGVTSHEVDMVRASKVTIVSAEQVVPAGSFDAEPEGVTISSAYVTAVVQQPHGAFPTSVYRQYDYSEADIVEYQRIAKLGGPDHDRWLQTNVTGHADFDAYLSWRDPGGPLRRRLAEQMGRLL